MKVLVAGDSEFFTKVSEFLTDLTSDVVHAGDPRSCIASLKSDSVDIVFLHESIAGDNPGSALGQIRSTAPRCSVISMTDADDENKALELIRLGSDEVMTAGDLRAGYVKRLVGRVWERSVASVQIISQISDFVLTHSFDGIVALDLQNRILIWNHAMERMFSRKHQEVLGKVATEVLPFEGLGQEIGRAVAGTSFAGETKSFVSRGKRRIYHPFYSPITSRSGNVVGVMAVFRDLTDRYDSELKLKEMDQRVEYLSDSIPKMVWMSGTDGVRNYFSSRWSDFLGGSRETYDNDGWLVYLHPQDRTKFTASYKTAIEERQSFHMEYRMRRHDNSFRRILDSGTPLNGPNDEFLGFIGSCTDISETGTTQHRMDAVDVSQLTRPFGDGADFPRRSAAVVEGSSTMENAPIGVWKLDRDLVITKASRAVAEQLGCQPSDLIGQPFYDIVSSVDRQSLETVLTKQTTIQLNGHNFDLSSAVERDSVCWDLAAWPLKDKAKEVIGVCVSTMEVEGTSDDRQREDFIATLVHDLKTPLIGADRTLELLINGNLGDVDSGQSEVLAMLRRSNQGLLRMVQNLIEVYRYEFSKPNLAFDPISLFDLASQCAQELAAVAEQKGLILEANLSSGQGEANVDTLAIKRVILNLLDNAIKFTSAGGIIKIWGEETPNQVAVFVKDTGIGIDSDELSKVFDRFWRSEKGKGQAVGTGLGLYLCKQIVDAHQGDIVADSRPGEGTVFTMRLPKQ